MKEITISRNIAGLRRRKGITQEQLASALNISPQAISKWETNTSQPDTQILPLIADFFGVSIDYLFYGEELTYDEIYDKVFMKTCAHDQMSKESYEDAHKLFYFAHNGISKGNLFSKGRLYDEPCHISCPNGLSLTSGKGYGAIITRGFFESINEATADFAETILPVLSVKDCLMVCMAVISMSDISYAELKDKTNFDDERLRKALDQLIDAKLVVEKQSKHKSLGYTYDITDVYHTCICIIIATIEMQRYTLEGINCCMGYGDYPINL